MILRKTLGKSAAMKDDLVMIFCKIEAVNSIPLPYADTDPGKSEVITPSHFLIGKRLVSLPDIESQHAFTNCDTKRQWKR